MINMNENKWVVNVWIIRIIRLVVLVLGWSSIIIGIVSSGGNVGFMFSTYTIQSNTMVLVWLSIAVLFQEKNRDHWFFSKIIRGAITLYITITFIIFAILLSPYYHPTGIEQYNNINLHYLVPIAFIVDWFLTEMDREYSWKYIVIWLAYPVFYLGFTLILGYLTNTYIYYFIDLNVLGIHLFIGICVILAGAFLSLGALYVFLNKKLGKHFR